MILNEDVREGATGWDKIVTPDVLPYYYTWPAINPRPIWFDWQPGRFDVMFDANGGAFSPDGAKTCACGQVANECYSLPPREPTWAGWQFAGYWTDPNGGELITPSTVVTLTEAHTVYAHWTVSPSVTTSLFESFAAGPVDGVKISCTAQMSVGDKFNAVPFVSAKPAKGIAVSAVLWFDKSTKTLVGVTGIGTGNEAIAYGSAAAPDSQSSA